MHYYVPHMHYYAPTCTAITSPQAVYRNLLPLYFPRSAEEESYATKALPAAIGDEMGEPIITERQIRILENPTTKGSSLL